MNASNELPSTGPCCLALHRRSRQHPQRVEQSLRAIAVGIGHQRRLQNAIVGCCRRDIADRVGRRGDCQIVGVIDDDAVGAKRIDIAMRLIEVRLCEAELRRRAVGRAGREKRLTR